MGRASTRHRVLRLEGDHGQSRIDVLVVEEPLELRVAGRTLAVTMRTPGQDMELAIGFLLSEGVIRAASDVATMRYCSGVDAAGRQTFNVLDVTLAPDVPSPEPAVSRALFTASSCGLCGAASIDAVRKVARFDLALDETQVEPRILAALPDRLRAAQAMFARTGGLHAAGLFEADGTLVCAREDVGRHNAVDKVLGWALHAGKVPLSGHVLLVSGRASFELTQKALLAGVPLLAAVSAPSSLAVDLAEEAGMGLVGFLRGPRMNVYAGAERLGVTAATT